MIMQRDPTQTPNRDAASLVTMLRAGVMVLMLAACRDRFAGSTVGSASGTPGLPTGTLAHGPFEIVAGVKRVSTGTFPTIGVGSLFASGWITVAALTDGFFYGLAGVNVAMASDIFAAIVLLSYCAWAVSRP